MFLVSPILCEASVFLYESPKDSLEDELNESTGTYTWRSDIHPSSKQTSSSLGVNDSESDISSSTHLSFFEDSAFKSSTESSNTLPAHIQMKSRSESDISSSTHLSFFQDSAFKSTSEATRSDLTSSTHSSMPPLVEDSIFESSSNMDFTSSTHSSMPSLISVQSYSDPFSYVKNMSSSENETTETCNNSASETSDVTDSDMRRRVEERTEKIMRYVRGETDTPSESMLESEIQELLDMVNAIFETMHLVWL